MKKQLMAGMMAASMALSLAACGGSAASSAASAADSTSGAASTSTAASTSSDEQVTLRFAWWGGDERANATMEVINKFMEENPNIKIEAEYGSSDGYHDKLATQLASGTAADAPRQSRENATSTAFLRRCFDAEFSKRSIIFFIFMILSCYLIHFDLIRSFDFPSSYREFPFYRAFPLFIGFLRRSISADLRPAGS